MKIVIDCEIPFLKGVFEPYAEVVFKPGNEIVHEDLIDADALIVRTRTKCDKALLDGTSVKIISTATIGLDHIDREFCQEHGIFVNNAAGCNSGGVMNYVFSALYGIASRKSIPLSGATFGVIGLGSAGSRVAHMARALGFKVLQCDPVREADEGSTQFCSLDFLLDNSDIVTLHVPLNDNTRGMVNEEFFSKMRFSSFFINTSAGGIIVEKDLLEALPKLGPVVIDTWENEPNINRELLNLVDIATPHIAGYSYQGKQLATADAVRPIARFFGIKELFDFYPTTDIQELEAVKIHLEGKTQGQIAAIMQYNYPIFTDDFMFRLNPGNFEELRRNYRYRREFYID